MTTASGYTAAIPASRVIGTAVYNTSGDQIGEIKDVMLDKTTNNIMFGVAGFGGFLGMGEKFHPIPWASLNYDKDRKGYVVPYTKEVLEKAPAHSIDELTENDGAGVRDAAFDYYKVDRYWP